MANEFIYAKTKQLFLNELDNANISESTIAFIEDTKEIWNHGTYFKCNDLDSKNLCTKETLTVELQNKQDVLKSGINIKTINDLSILGEGNIAVSGELSYDIKDALVKCFNSVAWTTDKGPELMNNLTNALNYVERPKYNLTLQGYIADGLIMHFDGIDNWVDDSGVSHKDTIDRWCDLIGNKTLTCYGDNTGSQTKTITVTENSVVFDGSTYFFPENKNYNTMFDANTDGTLEIVLKETSGSHVATAFASFAGDSHEPLVKGLWYRPSSNSYICYYSKVATSAKTGFKSNRCTTPSSISIAYSSELTDLPLYIYLNNILQVSENCGGTMPCSSEFAIGGRYMVKSSDVGYPFKGEIYAVRYYNRILSEEERLINYNSDKARFNI